LLYFRPDFFREDDFFGEDDFFAATRPP
jgi:hypothetical protein